MKKILILVSIFFLSIVVTYITNSTLKNTDTPIAEEQVMPLVPNMNWVDNVAQAWAQWDKSNLSFKQIETSEVFVESQRYRDIVSQLPEREVVSEDLDDDDKLLLRDRVAKIDLSTKSLEKFNAEIIQLIKHKNNYVLEKNKWNAHAQSEGLGFPLALSTKHKKNQDLLQKLLNEEKFILAKNQYNALSLLLSQLYTDSLQVMFTKQSANHQQSLWVQTITSIKANKSLIDLGLTARNTWEKAKLLAQKGSFTEAKNEYRNAEKLWKKAIDDSIILIAMPNMISLSGGVFIMGDDSGKGQKDEKPAHDVEIHSFSISDTPITFMQYDFYTRLTQKKLANDSGWGRDKRPVINVSWQDAIEYTHWLSKISGLNYRLPTEAEWEYAARAGNQLSYGIGEKINNNAHCEGCNAWNQTRSIEVASFPANKYGLYDMQGNVWEWVQDCYDINYKRAHENGSAFMLPQCESRVSRGGSWQDLPSALRAANRSPLSADTKDNRVGFRVVIENAVKTSE